MLDPIIFLLLLSTAMALPSLNQPDNTRPISTNAEAENIIRRLLHALKPQQLRDSVSKSHRKTVVELIKNANIASNLATKPNYRADSTNPRTKMLIFTENPTAYPPIRSDLISRWHTTENNFKSLRNGRNRYQRAALSGQLEYLNTSNQSERPSTEQKQSTNLASEYLLRSSQKDEAPLISEQETAATFANIEFETTSYRTNKETLNLVSWVPLSQARDATTFDEVEPEVIKHTAEEADLISKPLNQQPKSISFTTAQPEVINYTEDEKKSLKNLNQQLKSTTTAAIQSEMIEHTNEEEEEITSEPWRFSTQQIESITFVDAEAEIFGDTTEEVELTSNFWRSIDQPLGTSTLSDAESEVISYTNEEMEFNSESWLISDQQLAQFTLIDVEPKGIRYTNEKVDFISEPWSTSDQQLTSSRFADSGPEIISYTNEDVEFTSEPWHKTISYLNEEIGLTSKPLRTLDQQLPPSTLANAQLEIISYTNEEVDLTSKSRESLEHQLGSSTFADAEPEIISYTHEEVDLTSTPLRTSNQKLTTSTFAETRPQIIKRKNIKTDLISKHWRFSNQQQSTTFVTAQIKPIRHTNEEIELTLKRWKDSDLQPRPTSIADAQLEMPKYLDQEVVSYSGLRPTTLISNVQHKIVVGTNKELDLTSKPWRVSDLMLEELESSLESITVAEAQPKIVRYTDKEVDVASKSLKPHRLELTSIPDSVPEIIDHTNKNVDLLEMNETSTSVKSTEKYDKDSMFLNKSTISNFNSSLEPTLYTNKSLLELIMPEPTLNPVQKIASVYESKIPAATMIPSLDPVIFIDYDEDLKPNNSNSSILKPKSEYVNEDLFRTNPTILTSHLTSTVFPSKILLELIMPDAIETPEPKNTQLDVANTPVFKMDPVFPIVENYPEPQVNQKPTVAPIPSKSDLLFVENPSTSKLYPELLLPAVAADDDALDEFEEYPEFVEELVTVVQEYKNLTSITSSMQSNPPAISYSQSTPTSYFGITETSEDANTSKSVLSLNFRLQSVRGYTNFEPIIYSALKQNPPTTQKIVEIGTKLTSPKLQMQTEKLLVKNGSSKTHINNTRFFINLSVNPQLSEKLATHAESSVKTFINTEVSVKPFANAESPSEHLANLGSTVEAPKNSKYFVKPFVNKASATKAVTNTESAVKAFLNTEFRTKPWGNAESPPKDVSNSGSLIETFLNPGYLVNIPVNSKSPEELVVSTGHTTGNKISSVQTIEVGSPAKTIVYLTFNEFNFPLEGKRNDQSIRKLVQQYTNPQSRQDGKTLGEDSNSKVFNYTSSSSNNIKYIVFNDFTFA